jgi:hypothetical protein
MAFRRVMYAGRDVYVTERTFRLVEIFRPGDDKLENYALPRSAKEKERDYKEIHHITNWDEKVEVVQERKGPSLEDQDLENDDALGAIAAGFTKTFKVAQPPQQERILRFKHRKPDFSLTPRETVERECAVKTAEAKMARASLFFGRLSSSDPSERRRAQKLMGEMETALKDDAVFEWEQFGVACVYFAPALNGAVRRSLANTVAKRAQSRAERMVSTGTDPMESKSVSTGTDPLTSVAVSTGTDPMTSTTTSIGTDPEDVAVVREEIEDNFEEEKEEEVSVQPTVSKKRLREGVTADDILEDVHRGELKKGDEAAFVAAVEGVGSHPVRKSDGKFHLKHNLSPSDGGAWSHICTREAAVWTTRLRGMLSSGQIKKGEYDGHVITPEEWNAGGYSELTKRKIGPERRSHYQRFSRGQREKVKKALSKYITTAKNKMEQKKRVKEVVAKIAKKDKAAWEPGQEAKVSNAELLEDELSFDVQIEEEEHEDKKHVDAEVVPEFKCFACGAERDEMEQTCSNCRRTGVVHEENPVSEYHVLPRSLLHLLRIDDESDPEKSTRVSLRVLSLLTAGIYIWETNFSEGFERADDTTSIGKALDADLFELILLAFLGPDPWNVSDFFKSKHNTEFRTEVTTLTKVDLDHHSSHILPLLRGGEWEREDLTTSDLEVLRGEGEKETRREILFLSILILRDLTSKAGFEQESEGAFAADDAKRGKIVEHLIEQEAFPVGTTERQIVSAAKAEFQKGVIALLKHY